MNEKELMQARIILKDSLAAKARREWRTKTADKEALANRVLLWDLISNGDEITLNSIAKYFNIRFNKNIEQINVNAYHIAKVGTNNSEIIAVKVSKI